MPAISATAPGKAILFGEHAVVYNKPAIAVPVTQVRAKAVVLAEPLWEPGKVLIEAPDIKLEAGLTQLAADHPFSILINGLMETAGIARLPAMRLRITSTIPVAAGLGSGAAVSVALARALSDFLGLGWNETQISDLAFKVEKAHHGNPSGIDNTVISWEKPVYFIRNRPFLPLKVAEPFTLLVADCGVQSPTSLAVEAVRQARASEPGRFDQIFSDIGKLVEQARRLIEHGPVESLGPLMTANQNLLVQMGVSCVELDHLVSAAMQAGASGAKLSGAGRGGNMIALVTPATVDAVSAALTRAGAVRVLKTRIQPE